MIGTSEECLATYDKPENFRFYSRHSSLLGHDIAHVGNPQALFGRQCVSTSVGKLCAMHSTSKALVTRSDALVPTSFLVTTSKALVTRSDALVPTSFLVTTSKALVTRSDALVPSSFLLLLVRHLLLEAMHLFLLAFLLLLVRHLLLLAWHLFLVASCYY